MQKSKKKIREIDSFHFTSFLAWTIFSIFRALCVLFDNSIQGSVDIPRLDFGITTTKSENGGE